MAPILSRDSHSGLDELLPAEGGALQIGEKVTLDDYIRLTVDAIELTATFQLNCRPMGKEAKGCHVDRQLARTLQCRTRWIHVYGVYRAGNTEQGGRDKPGLATWQQRIRALSPDSRPTSIAFTPFPKSKTEILQIGMSRITERFAMRFASAVSL
jgi:hypothetical protein